MGSEHENTGGFAPNRKRETLETTIIFLRIKQFVPKKMKAICIKRLYFVQICCRTPHGVRGFKLVCVAYNKYKTMSHSAWSAWI